MHVCLFMCMYLCVYDIACNIICMIFCDIYVSVWMGGDLCLDDVVCVRIGLYPAMGVSAFMCV